MQWHDFCRRDRRRLEQQEEQALWRGIFEATDPGEPWEQEEEP